MNHFNRKIAFRILANENFTIRNNNIVLAQIEITKVLEKVDSTVLSDSIMSDKRSLVVSTGHEAMLPILAIAKRLKPFDFDL